MQDDKDQVIKLLGIGGDQMLLDFPKNHKQWASRATASFSRWRTMSQDDVGIVRGIAKDFHADDRQSNRYERASAVADIALVGSLHTTGKDILFTTGQQRQLFQTFTGRSAVTLQGGDSTSPSYRQIEGDTSIITLARCDAYVATWLCVLVRGAELPKVRHSSSYNVLSQSLVPYAVCDILGVCREELTRHPSSVDELLVPYKYSSFYDAQRRSGNVNDSDATELEDDAAVAKILDAERNVDGVTLPHSSVHKLDFYLCDVRESTVHFYDDSDEKNYCVLTAEFVRKEICSWIGDVRDVFVGTLDNDDAVHFRPLTGADTCVLTPVPVESSDL